jgi:hypothetical protein
VQSLRNHLLQRRWLAFWLVGFALLMRMAVPAGYMPMFSGSAITIELCSGYGPVEMTMAMPGMADHHDGKSTPGKGEMPCGFSALSTPSRAGADPIQLALAIIFIVETALLGATLIRITRIERLRPPLRGPPLAA